MLASPYLTPAQLGITQEIFNGLLRVRDELRSGELKYWRLGQPPVQNGFNMGTWNWPSDYNCGTVHCIGGWLHAWGAMSNPEFNEYPESLRSLFVPQSMGAMFHDITPAQAADAIERWLSGDRHPYAPR